MQNREIVDSWLAQIPSQVESLKLDESNRCHVDLNEVTACFVEVPHESGEVNFFCPVLPLPDAEEAAERQALYDKLLTMNLPSGITRGAALAVDVALDAVMLRFSRTIASLDQQSFMNILGGMGEIVSRIRQEILDDNGLDIASDSAPQTSWMKA